MNILPEIEWTKERIRRFEQMRAKGRRRYIVTEALTRFGLSLFMFFMVMTGLKTGWNLLAMAVVVLVGGPIAFGGGCLGAFLVWQYYEKSYERFVAEQRRGGNGGDT